MHLRIFAASTLVAALALGCGYSEEEWQAQLDKYNKLMAEKSAADQRAAKLQSDLELEKARVAELSQKLQKALEEYRARAKQLEAIKARFEMLRKKLDELTKLGLAVNIRKNRMVISLPGDVLFDSGRETLKKDGQEILVKVAQIIKNDQSLLGRDYQVAGHTDNKPFNGGIFRDNWGLSLMRAREVLLFLVSDKGGQMPNARWSAAGFGDTDPIAPNETDEGRQKNRRCDIIVVPSVEEMLDLKAITQ
jgi:chemotaxis protein MotB